MLGSDNANCAIHVLYVFIVICTGSSIYTSYNPSILIDNKKHKHYLILFEVMYTFPWHDNTQ